MYEIRILQSAITLTVYCALWCNQNRKEYSTFDWGFFYNGHDTFPKYITASGDIRAPEPWFSLGWPQFQCGLLRYFFVFIKDVKRSFSWLFYRSPDLSVRVRKQPRTWGTVNFGAEGSSERSVTWIAHFAPLPVDVCIIRTITKWNTTFTANSHQGRCWFTFESGLKYLRNNEMSIEAQFIQTSRFWISYSWRRKVQIQWHHNHVCLIRFDL